MVVAFFFIRPVTNCYQNLMIQLHSLNSNWYWYYVFFLSLAIAMDRNNRKSLRLPPQHYISVCAMSEWKAQLFIIKFQIVQDAKKPECVEQENRNNKTI